MTPRRRAILVVLLALLLLAAIVGIVLFLTRAIGGQPGTSGPVVEPAPIEETETTPTTEEKFVNPLISVEPASDARIESRQIAELFAERYGSYSNQGDYRNLRDLLPVMTTRYRAETEAFLEGAETPVGQPYEGVTSRRISTDVRDVDEDSAVIAISLQQSRVVGASDPTVGYRILRMELRKVGEDWYVDRATWEG